MRPAGSHSYGDSADRCVAKARAAATTWALREDEPHLRVPDPYRCSPAFAPANAADHARHHLRSDARHGAISLFGVRSRHHNLNSLR